MSDKPEMAKRYCQEILALDKEYERRKREAYERLHEETPAVKFTCRDHLVFSYIFDENSTLENAKEIVEILTNAYAMTGVTEFELIGHEDLDSTYPEVVSASERSLQECFSVGANYEVQGIWLWKVHDKFLKLASEIEKERPVESSQKPFFTVYLE